jgi:hypothetical protein
MSNQNENKKSLLDSIRSGFTNLIGRSQVIPEPFQNADNTATIQSNDQFAVVPYVPLPGDDSSTQSSNSSNSNSSNSSSSNSSNNQQDAPMTPSGSRLKPLSHYADNEAEEDNDETEPEDQEEDNEDDQFAVVPYGPSLPSANSPNNQQDDEDDDETESDQEEDEQQQQPALPQVEQPAYPMMAIPQEPSYPAVIRPRHSYIQPYNAANGPFLPAIPRELYAPLHPTYALAECKTPQDCEMANRMDNMLGFAQQQFSRFATFPTQALPRVNDPLFRLPDKPSKNSGDREELLSESLMREFKNDAEVILAKLSKMRNTVKQASMNAFAAERCHAKAERYHRFKGDQKQRRADALDEARRAQIQFLQDA